MITEKIFELVSSSTLDSADKAMFESIGIHALTPEMRLLVAIDRNGPMPIKRAIIESGLSYRGFYNVIGRLVELGLLERNSSAEDGRVHYLKQTTRQNPDHS